MPWDRLMATNPVWQRQLYMLARPKVICYCYRPMEHIKNSMRNILYMYTDLDYRPTICTN